MTSSVHWRPWDAPKGDTRVKGVRTVPIERLLSRSTISPGEGMTNTIYRTTRRVPEAMPTSAFIPITIGDTTISRQTTAPLRAIASKPVPRPLPSTTAPTRLPGIKLTISTLRPFRVTKINPSPNQLPRIPSEMSDFEVYNPRNGDVWAIQPQKLHLVRKRAPIQQWASLTPVTDKNENTVRE